MNETLQTIFTRKSVRKFTDREVEKDKIELILRAAMSAPSACNQQPWEFICVTDQKVLNELGEKLPYAKMLIGARLAFIVAADMNKALGGQGRIHWIDDCSAASENILLAAHSLGLGAVWTAVHPGEDRIKTVREVLNLPESVIPLNVIPVGYPAEDPKVRDKFKTENIHYNKW